MRKRFFVYLLFFAVLQSTHQAAAQEPRFKVLAFYSTKVEPDHVLFAEGALKFFPEIAKTDHFAFDTTTDWNDMNDANLAKYQIVVWLNDQPAKPDQRRAFQKYIESGGAWLGFHVTAYNDKDTNWPWFVDFLGGGVFESNSWPPLPATLTVDDKSSQVTAHVPQSFLSPDNEWYIWNPSPRLNKNVKVLVSLDPSNYPIGLKDVLKSGDLPVVWTNVKYRMLYMNMGHGDKIFTSPTQNKLIEDGLLWLGNKSAAAEVPPASGARISLHGVAVNPITNKVYAVNTSDGTVTVMSGSTNATTTVRVGPEPMAIAVNSVTNKIYVANSGDDSTSVIDGSTDAVTATVKVGTLPYVVAVNPITNKIYISRTFGNAITVIDGATNATSTLQSGLQADAIAVNAKANKVYFTNYENKNVTVLDGATNGTTAVPAEVHIWAIAVNPATNTTYLAGAGSSNLIVIDGVSNAVSTIKTGQVPCAIAVDEVRNRVYAVNYASKSVTVIDGANHSIIATVMVGSGPQAIAVNSVTNTIYVANTRDNNVMVIDGATHAVVMTIRTGNGPYAIAIDEVNNRAYVSSMDKPNLTVIDGRQVPTAAVSQRAIGDNR